VNCFCGAVRGAVKAYKYAGRYTTLPIIADVRAPLTNLYLRFSPYQMPASLE
jgi:hypothetical protein